jgi:hypothetical protein
LLQDGVNYRRGTQNEQQPAVLGRSFQLGLTLIEQLAEGSMASLMRRRVLPDLPTGLKIRYHTARQLGGERRLPVRFQVGRGRQCLIELQGEGLM